MRQVGCVTWEQLSEQLGAAPMTINVVPGALPVTNLHIWRKISLSGILILRCWGHSYAVT